MKIFNKPNDYGTFSKHSTAGRTHRAYYPNATIIGHRDLNRGKVCPCFDATEYNTIV